MCTSRVERFASYIDTVVLKAIVHQKMTGHISQQFFANCLAIDATLKLSERQRLSIAPRQQFTVQHRSIRQPFRGRFNLGKSASKQLFATAPEKCAALSTHQLRTDTVPFPLCLPLVHIAKRRRITVDRMREKERIRSTPIGVGRLRADQLREPLGRRFPLPHQTMSDCFDGNATQLRERTHDESVGHANTK